MATLLSAREIGPGKRGLIAAQVDTQELEGRCTKLIMVETNDPRNSQIVLMITAEIKPELFVSSRLVYFGTLPRGTMAERKVDVILSEDANCNIQSVECTNEHVAIRTEALGKEKRGVRIIATLKENAPVGSQYGNILVKTSSHAMPMVTIPVRGVIVGRK